MKKINMGFLVLFFMACGTAFADEIVTASDPVHDVINSIIPMALAGLTALLAWITNTLKKWITKVTADTKTGESSKFYALAFNLAGMAVKLAETKFGPDSSSGMKKRQEAVEWLKARLLAVDPKLKISDSDLSGFVDAAYHDVFAVVSPLGKGAGQ